VQPSPAAELQPAIALLERTPIVLETLLPDLPQEILEWKPSEERWSIREVVAHLVDLEELFCERTQRIVREERPALAKFVPAGKLLGGPSADALERLVRFGLLRRGLVGFVREVPASAALRTGVHEELGPVTLAQVLNELANHDLGHLRQIAELYRARAFYPNVGPFQRYSSPQP
jgi:hypothetical protein